MGTGRKIKILQMAAKVTGPAKKLLQMVDEVGVAAEYLK